MYKNLPERSDEKLISNNFGTIGHLSGSKLIDEKDKLLNEEEQRKFTVCKRDKNDLVIITEKIDGMNAGVAKKNGYLYPVNKQGYDVRNMGSVNKELEILGVEWAKWVDENYPLYDKLLVEGERLVFENCIVQHTLRYNFRNDPVFLLAKYNLDGKRINYQCLTELAKSHGIQQPPLLNIGVALPAQLVINQYPKGLIGVQGQIEGIVYNYEHNNEHIGCAKYVSNPLMGTINPKVNFGFYNKYIRGESIG
jgi:hypothetical protein